MTQHHAAKTSQQIRFVEMLFYLRWYVETYFEGLETILVFKFVRDVFGGGTRLAMPKTILRARLVVIEAWFRGY